MVEEIPERLGPRVTEWAENRLEPSLLNPRPFSVSAVRKSPDYALHGEIGLLLGEKGIYQRLVSSGVGMETKMPSEDLWMSYDCMQNFKYYCFLGNGYSFYQGLKRTLEVKKKKKLQGRGP